MGVVVSVNVGLPRDVEWQGKIVRTGIWKEPVASRVFAGRLNLAGDGQADLSGHGGEQRAIMVYQLDSYRHWAAHLARPDLGYGSFGENLTVDGLADTEVCIGDRFRIGTGVFEISQPRVTCYKVGLRLDHPAMPALLVSHRRPGFYFRVIEEGEIGAGDPIEKIADGPEAMTVAEIDALLYSADHPVEALERAVRIPALSPGWQRSINSLLKAAQAGGRTGNAGLGPGASAPLAWRGFRSVTVVGTNMESTEVRSFDLAADDGTPLPPALPGQHVVVRVRPGPDAAVVARNYSLCSAPNAPLYRIGVKNEGGLASGYLHRAIQVGNRLEISAPRGSFTLADGTSAIVLLSAGVGVTPLLSMLHAAAEAASPRPVWWLHGARDGAHQAFGNEADAVLRRLPIAHRWIFYSRPAAEDRMGRDFDRQGHLSLAVLQELGVPRDADFYLCGPAKFLDDLQADLTGWQVDPARIHVEVFGPGGSPAPGPTGAAAPRPHAPIGPQGKGPIVTFARSGLAVPWDDRFASLLELAEACAVPVRWSCRSGVCHNCESGLIDGQLNYAPEPLDAPADGNALICCARPVSAVELDL
ncbi:MAG TPA: MOSC and FAD-binding oxidoreductase domain-containing protein [Aliidongia sp.]|nr:MOSC and FAD-binding oxidoreductase domain-containing protein [Aliidongia sp.]